MCVQNCERRTLSEARELLSCSTLSEARELLSCSVRSLSRLLPRRVKLWTSSERISIESASSCSSSSIQRSALTMSCPVTGVHSASLRPVNGYVPAAPSIEGAGSPRRSESAAVSHVSSVASSMSRSRVLPVAGMERMSRNRSIIGRSIILFTSRT